MADLIPNINGKHYAWASISVLVLGTPVVGIRGIKYDDKQEIENVYGQGSRPIGYGFGNVESSASITLTADEVEKITAIAPNGNLQEIPPFNVVVAYLESKVVTHTLRNCIIKGNKREAKQGDKMLEVELELHLSHIEWK